LIKYLLKLNIKDAIIEYEIKRKMNKLKKNWEYSLSHLV
jgi:hypothetical protein